MCKDRNTLETKEKRKKIFILRRQTASESEARNPGDISKLQRKLVKGSQQHPSGVHTSTAWRTRGIMLPFSLYNQILFQNNILNNLYNSLTLQSFLKFSYKRFIPKILNT